MTRFIIFITLIINLRILLAHGDEFDDFIKSPLGSKPGLPASKSISAPPVTEGVDDSLAKKLQESINPATPNNYPPYQKSVLKSFKKWTALTANPRGTKMCYAVVFSQKRIGNFPNNAPESQTGKKDIPSTDQAKLPYFMVHYFDPYTQRISIFFNYQIKAGSTVTLTIVKSLEKKLNFELIPLRSMTDRDDEYSGMYAVSEDGETDTAIVSALLNSTLIEVRAEGEDNTYSVDKYIAEGFIQVYNKMKQECSPQTF